MSTSRNGEGSNLTENEPLLPTTSSSSPLSKTSRPSNRRRTVSSNSIVQTESYRKSYYLGICGLFLALILISGSIIMIKRANKRQHNGDLPDFSKGLPPPPLNGFRNPAYFSSGYQGAVASEVDLCSEVGVAGKLLSDFNLNRIKINRSRSKENGY